MPRIFDANLGNTKQAAALRRVSNKTSMKFMGTHPHQKKIGFWAFGSQDN
ncbi:hypothetical protein NWP22_15300 [Anabaenopsis tanganyikae CS-531]|uniref:Uncharacterized protein n=2 Tax=Anabaenopsis TaxID=110103 RepID=A0ABT5AM85_9CYAN|nr:MULTISPECIES: hypothetical protein [Anabaenopsis]MDB9538407.1 hypothetical protein [Anabaenopsis arnoldii]MDH6090674.1 hypothetical protein [Anabaenopsis arnoldii]MDH6107210.1 hypothetical protein [Anabaenopsis tanganyikae CS-531]